ncbi:MAG: type IV pilus twitching motility protein PilT [Candidatus Abyssobacteria bacterium SURF_17]|uniref:Type IV pilus twitching motility protein PilT n=1 Tax=Candidatus Abyssobacteria bacterium SURF_17 TaxID=2093361 RepID=A0A419F8J2_9BACT|nr:MAG: type IV pilus twitching motility protein PilT [Candidatus Abyssubacteria bacterium SURF_17]
MLQLEDLCRQMVENNASDLHLVVGAPPQLRIDGELHTMDTHVLTPEVTKNLAYSILTERQIKEFEHEKELDMSFGIKGLSRFRVNLFVDRGSVCAAIRTIPYEVLSFEELGIPKCVRELAERPQGLVLVCGPTGCGKSTTLAALINKINSERRCHIVTIEDPIEYLHAHRQCIINQREVYSDTHSFPAALKHILRQDPDVIMIGEMRDLETIESALVVAETGHLVFATLHANDAGQTINRMIDVFPPHQQLQVRTQLSFVLEGVIVQKLMPRKDLNGRVLGLEIMMVTPAIRNLIREDKVHQIYSAISTGGALGSQTMNQSLHKLYKSGQITYEQALENSPNQEDLLRLMGKGF